MIVLKKNFIKYVKKCKILEEKRPKIRKKRILAKIF